MSTKFYAFIQFNMNEMSNEHTFTITCMTNAQFCYTFVWFCIPNRHTFFGGFSVVCPFNAQIRQFSTFRQTKPCFWTNNRAKMLVNSTNNDKKGEIYD